MSNWEYKVISSGKGGFASPALMEKFINDLGQDQWEIIGFHTAPDNSLAFTGLARRPTQRDWTLEDAAKAAARAEADKLRAEFEAKFKAATAGAATGSAAEEPGETFLAEEKTGADDGLRRLRDTSRDDDPDAPEEENGNGNGGGPKDEWDKLAAEDELPTFFDALRPHMRRNQRGPGMSVGVDFLAKKWRLEEADIKGALVECGLQIPADENARPVYVEYEGDLYWVNINRRGEIWINTREKPEPIFRIVQARRVEGGEEPAAVAENAGAAGALVPDPVLVTRPQPVSAPQGQRAPRPEPASGPKTFLDRIRSLMRRNHRGHGLSGSFQYLTKALKIDDAQLLAQLGEQGLRLPEGDQRSEAEVGDFVYWLNRNQRGEIWINAELKRRGPSSRGATPVAAEAAGAGSAPETTDGEPQAAALETTAARAETPIAVQASAAQAAPGAVSAETLMPTENTLGAVRLLMQPKKRGEGVTALVAELAAQLGKAPEELQAALAAAGLHLPESPKAKPTFAEFGGEIFWLNANAKGQVWLNAKAASATKKSRAKKPVETE